MSDEDASRQREEDDRKRRREREGPGDSSAPSWFVSFETRLDTRFSSLEAETKATKDNVGALEDRVSALEGGKGASKGRRANTPILGTPRPNLVQGTRGSPQAPAASTDGEAPLNRTVVGGFDAATRRQVIEDFLRGLVRDVALNRVEDRSGAKSAFSGLLAQTPCGRHFVGLNKTLRRPN
eukprot:6491002-Amphidinium_carterae.5